jgi:hypothetical protein
MLPTAPLPQGDRAATRRVKARVFASSLLDTVVDIALPLLVYAVLTAFGLSAYLALAAGGILVAAKAALGRLAAGHSPRRTAFVASMTVLALAALGLLAAAGAPEWLAATVGGVIAVVPVVESLLRGSGVDGVGLLVLAEIAASIVITMISEDPRFLLARPAVYTAIAGGYALVTSRIGRPLMLDASKPMAAAGDPVRAQAFENAWATNPRFRTIERAMTAALGVVLLAEAALRIVVVYASAAPDLSAASLLAQLPAIGLLVAYLLAVRLLAVPRVRVIVDQEARRLNGATSVPRNA